MTTEPTEPTKPAAETLRHRYFVSYSYARGFGCTMIGLRLPVRGMADILAMTGVIERDLGPFSQVVILNFQRLPDETPA